MAERLTLIGKISDAIADWKAPYEVAEALNISTKQAESFLWSMVRMGRAEYGKPNHTFRARSEGGNKP